VTGLWKEPRRHVLVEAPGQLWGAAEPWGGSEIVVTIERPGRPPLAIGRFRIDEIQQQSAPTGDVEIRGSAPT